MESASKSQKKKQRKGGGAEGKKKMTPRPGGAFSALTPSMWPQDILTKFGEDSAAEAEDPEGKGSRVDVLEVGGSEKGIFGIFGIFLMPFSGPARGTVRQNSQELGRKYWATRSSVRSFARTAHSFACAALLASLSRSLTPELVGQ